MNLQMMNSESTQIVSDVSSPPSVLKTGGAFSNMEKWEVATLIISCCLVVFVAIPKYFSYLDWMRGKESSARLTLVANCLKYLADQNHTKPGEKICELFDLNETLELAQQRIYKKVNMVSQNNLFLKIGAEPDDPGGGDYVVNLFLGADGNIIEPTCTLAFGSEGEYYRKNGLYTADMSKVNGDIGIKD